jgi:hypothetical protein
VMYTKGKGKKNEIVQKAVKGDGNNNKKIN